MRSMCRCGTLASVLLLSACSTSSHVVVGTPRPAISPDSVRVYTQPPPHFEQVATLSASSQGSFAITSQQNMDKAIERLKAEAAKLGANGILLGEIRDQQTGSIGTGVGNSSYGPGGGSSVGVGGSFGITNKAVNGMAIYVPPETPAQQPSPPPQQPSSPPQAQPH